MELAGFARVSLNAGESKRVVFDLAASQLAYVDRENQWFVEAGEIDIMIGSSSNDIRFERRDSHCGQQANRWQGACLLRGCRS